MHMHIVIQNRREYAQSHPKPTGLCTESSKTDTSMHIVIQNRRKYAHSRPKPTQACTKSSKTDASMHIVFQNQRKLHTDDTNAHAHSHPKPTRVCTESSNTDASMHSSTATHGSTSSLSLLISPRHSQKSKKTIIIYIPISRFPVLSMSLPCSSRAPNCHCSICHCHCPSPRSDLIRHRKKIRRASTNGWWSRGNTSPLGFLTRSRCGAPAFPGRGSQQITSVRK